MEAKLVGKGQTALVTGASGGIGEDLAECFAAAGYDLILCARSQPRLDAVASRLAKDHRVEACAKTIDLAEAGAGTKLAGDLRSTGFQVNVLVNNAGYGVAGAFAGSDLAAQLGVVDLNDRAVVELTHQFWGEMLRKGSGGVLNVSSTAAFLPGPLMSIYYASKAFLLSFSEALWEEARGTGVKVSCLCPGPTISGFRARAGTTGTRMAQNGGIMDSKAVARLGYTGFQSNRRVVVPGASNKAMARLAPFVPRGTALRIVRRMLEPATA